MIYSRVFDIRGDNFSNTDSRITKIHTLIQSFFSASLEGGKCKCNYAKASNLCKQARWWWSRSSLRNVSHDPGFIMILRHLAVWLESHHPSEPVVSSLFFFSLINVDPTDVGDRDCRMLKKDYPSYACFFQCQYYNKEASKLILEPTKDPFGFLIFTYCTSDELDLGSVQIASNRHPKRAHAMGKTSNRYGIP